MTGFPRSTTWAGALAIALAAPAHGFDLRSLFSSNPPTGTVPPAAPAPSTSEWSGESGASGHPAMQADAIRAAAANFGTCLEGLWPQAWQRSVPRELYDAQVRGLTPDLRIMDLLDAQPEFTKSIWEYLDVLVSDARIETGRALLAQHRATFDAVEKAYGVDRHFVAAIWGVADGALRVTPLRTLTPDEADAVRAEAERLLSFLDLDLVLAFD